MNNGTNMFNQADVLWHKTPTAKIAYRKFGDGPPLVFIHGWPLWGFTFRKLLPHLTNHFTCYLIDVPGGGTTEWTEDTDFTWPGQAANIKLLLNGLELDDYYLLGQDSGAMIARFLCLLDQKHIRKFVMTNTEVPGHRPPYLPLLRRLLFLPGSNLVFRWLMSGRAFARTRFAFGGSFEDRSLIQGEFYDNIVQPLVLEHRRMAGHNRFLRGWSWEVLDKMPSFHRQITVPVRLIWGARDETFPLGLAYEMAGQFGNNGGVEVIGDARLFVHEEKPAEVAEAVKEFLLQ